jgi:hypothetical protein
LQFAQANAQTINWKELALPTQTKIVFKKFSNASKKNTPTHSPTYTADNDAENQY